MLTNLLLIIKKKAKKNYRILKILKSLKSYKRICYKKNKLNK